LRKKKNSRAVPSLRHRKKTPLIHSKNTWEETLQGIRRRGERDEQKNLSKVTEREVKEEPSRAVIRNLL